MPDPYMKDRLFTRYLQIIRAYWSTVASVSREKFIAFVGLVSRDRNYATHREGTYATHREGTKSCNFAVRESHIVERFLS